ncbi:cell division protein FtsQ/DivIB [Candidatus Pelagibacter communis]|uniref:cell division protein FtsQ/DivIB n=1 Tax=Pelagibacter ubique TaxID=198252 RepID=UPI00092D3276|nr:FtsQ-type POTRA domain-containing protein [Candidatus Pelagibacter ubique]
MHQRKSKKLLIYFFLLILISSTNNISLNNLEFQKVKNIEVSGLSEIENSLIIEKIKNLNLNNIFFINKKEINDLMNSNPLIEKYQIFKSYPSAIKIMIKKTSFIAKINFNNETFVIGSNGKLIPNNLQATDLPYIFGKPQIQEFLIFKKIVDKSKFSFEEIESLFFFPSKRWDIKLKNNILLKLPHHSTIASLDYAYEFLEDNNIGKFTIIDIRIDNQIILNE